MGKGCGKGVDKGCGQGMWAKNVGKGCEQTVGAEEWVWGVGKRCGQGFGRGVWAWVWARDLGSGCGPRAPIGVGKGVGQCWPGVGNGCARDATGASAVQMLWGVNVWA